MTIQTAPELYAHAIAIEREAAERYTELAVRMDDEGREDLARLLAREMAAEEQEHVALIEAMLERTPQDRLASTALFPH